MYAVCIHLEQQQAFPSSLMCVRAFEPVSGLQQAIARVTIAKSLYKQKEWMEVKETLIAQ